MKKIVVAVALCLSSLPAFAQSSPNLTFGFVPTPQLWNSYFQSKQDTLGYTPLNTSGGVMLGPLITFASSSTQAGLNIPPGIPPGTPNNGDIWTTSAGIFVQINGSTEQLLSTTSPCTTCAVVNGANNFSVTQVVNLNGGSLGTALTGTALRAANANSVATRFEADAYGATAYFSAVAYGGTLASPTALGSGVEIGGVNGWGYNGAAVVGPSAAFRLYTNGVWSVGSQPTYADVAVTPSGSTAEIEAVKFTATSTTAVNQLLGTPGTIVGSLSFGNATSGTETISPATGALGSGIATLPAGTYNLVGDSLTQILTNKTMTSSTDVLGGVTMTLGSDSNGDIYCRSGGVLTRIPGGGSATVLTSGGATVCPTWISPTGGGNVSNTGTPVANQIAQFTNATTIQGISTVAAAQGGSGVASPTAHAVLVGEGSSAFNSIGPGTVGQFDAAQGASADPSFTSGPWTLLATLTASNSATLSDTTHITSSYNDYELVFENLISATASVTAEFQVHTGGAFQTTGYSGQTFLPNGTAISNNSWSTFAFLSTVTGVDNIAPGVNAKLFWSNPAAAGVHALYGQAVNANAAGPNAALTVIGGFWQSSSGLDGFQFFFSTGNIISGTIKIYARL